MPESSPLTCSLADQGIKIRIRKDIRMRKARVQGLERPLAHSLPSTDAALPMPTVVSCWFCCCCVKALVLAATASLLILRVVPAASAIGTCYSSEQYLLLQRAV
jgi:hypothetical protein